MSFAPVVRKQTARTCTARLHGDWCCCVRAQVVCRRRRLPVCVWCDPWPRHRLLACHRAGAVLQPVGGSGVLANHPLPGWMHVSHHSTTAPLTRCAACLPAPSSTVGTSTRCLSCCGTPGCPPLCASRCWLASSTPTTCFRPPALRRRFCRSAQTGVGAWQTPACLTTVTCACAFSYQACHLVLLLAVYLAPTVYGHEDIVCTRINGDAALRKKLGSRAGAAGAVTVVGVDSKVRLCLCSWSCRPWNDSLVASPCSVLPFSELAGFDSRVVAGGDRDACRSGAALPCSAAHPICCEYCASPCSRLPRQPPSCDARRVSAVRSHKAMS